MFNLKLHFPITDYDKNGDAIPGWEDIEKLRRLYGIIKKIKGKKVRKECFFSAMQTKFTAGVEPAPLLRMIDEISSTASTEVFLFYGTFNKI